MWRNWYSRTTQNRLEVTPCGFESHHAHSASLATLRRNSSKSSIPWGPVLAYIVGLITTDGCLSSDKRHIVLTSSDIDQLETFKKGLGLKNKIGMTRNARSVSYRVQFSNVNFYDWLVSIGLSDHKSLTLGKILIPDLYFRDFLRGHLDGDGSITTYTDYYNTNKNPSYVYERLWVRFISASENHIQWLQKKIDTLLKVTGRIHKRGPDRPNQHPMFVLKFAKKESLLLLHQLYYADDVPALKRKRVLYERFLTKM